MFIDRIKRLFAQTNRPAVNDVLTLHPHKRGQLHLAISKNLDAIAKLNLDADKYNSLFNTTLTTVTVSSGCKHALDLVSRCKDFTLDLSNLTIVGENYVPLSTGFQPTKRTTLAEFQYDGMSDWTVKEITEAIRHHLVSGEAVLQTLDDEQYQFFSLSIGRHITLMSEVGIYIDSISQL